MTDTIGNKDRTSGDRRGERMSGVTKAQIGGFLARQGILIAFAVFMIGFTIANSRFLDPDNVMGVVRSSAILGVMALGVTFVVWVGMTGAVVVVR